MKKVQTSQIKFHTQVSKAFHPKDSKKLQNVSHSRFKYIKKKFKKIPHSRFKKDQQKFSESINLNNFINLLEIKNYLDY